jgi:hypothetical protein
MQQEEFVMRYGTMSWGAVFVLATALLCSCAPKVKTRGLVPAEVNLSEYKRVTVLEFEGEAGDWGKKMAFWLEQELRRVRVDGKPYFTVVPRANLERVLEEHGLQTSDLTAAETSRGLGRILGLDAIITGSVEEARIEEFVYSTWRLYVTRTAHMDFTVHIISTETGESVFSKNFTGKKMAEAYDAVELTELTFAGEPLSSYVKKAISTFVRTIAPYYATLKLPLQSKDDSPSGPSKEVTTLLKKGNGHAENGDWNAALVEFRQAVQLQQGSPAANYNLGVVLEIKNQLQKAREHYETAARLKPDDEYMKAVARIKERLAAQEQVKQHFH